ncbi:MAG: shikimate dehydrogenase [Planctomycetota bacterium]
MGKICVSLGRGRHQQMMAEHQHVAQHGCELVELRVDWILRPVNVKRLLTDRPTPVIFTCRRENDGGRWTKPENERLMLLRSAIVEGVDYVDLEEDVAGSIPRYGKTKRIVSYHNFRETPDNLWEIHQRMQKLDADIVKLATLAHNQHDNLRMMRLVKEAPVPTIGLCMGETGMPTRILCGKFGSPFSFATLHAARTLAPGQLTYRDMRDLYRFPLVNAETEIYGVIADPVSHSLSPHIHNAGFASHQFNKVYLPFRVSSDELPSFLANCRELVIRGLSVTIPHKESAVRYLSQVEDAAQAVGAVNTIDFTGPTAVGSNTDLAAAVDSVVRAMGRADRSLPLEGVRVLLLGAGGVSRAIATGLTQQGAQCLVTGRTMSRAENLAQQVGGQAVEWEERSRVRCDLVVNCTPIGMHPNVNETPFPEGLLGHMVVFDTIYNPEQTLLIKQARAAGCAVITGVDMFVRQAALQYQVFTRQKAPVDVMRREVMRRIGAAQESQ